MAAALDCAPPAARRRQPPPPASEAPSRHAKGPLIDVIIGVGALMPEVARPDHELVERLGWFIRVRWLLVAGLGVAVPWSALLALDMPLGRALAVGAAVAAYNGAFAAHHRRLRGRPAPSARACRVEAGLQIGLDLAALTALIHFAGGAGTPFICFYLLHAIAGSMLLPERDAWLVGAAVFGFFVVAVVLDPATAPPAAAAALEGARGRQAAHLALVIAAFLVALVSTMAITSSIVRGLRLREAQLVAAQRALERKSADLEQAYAAVTDKQKQLMQAEKQASLGQLVAGVAHEINNPIQFIQGNLLILDEALTDVVRLLDAESAARGDLRIARLDYPFFRKQVPLLLKDMADGAARIGTIVRDLKTFARRDEGRLDATVDLNEVARAAMRLLHNRLKRFRVEEQLAPDLPKVRGNLTQLEQVVVNTLQNAAEAFGSDGEGGRISIRTGVEAGSDRVRLSIADEGAGMAPEVLDRIFDPFFTTKQRTGGTGLGLAITYGIIEQHRGEILVDSRPGQGTTFHFLLPVHASGVACAS
jgi:signal transduction histidine kinase